jgi:hypothetical protein
MAMRHGDYGKFSHEIYVSMGVGAITYNGITETDFTDVPLEDAQHIWRDLAPTQKASLKHLCYDIAGGDTVFIKAGPMIVNSGIVRGDIGQRAYRFNFAPDVGLDEGHGHWFQQVPVAWRSDFAPIRISIGSNQRHAIQKISVDDARRIRQEITRSIATSTMPTARDELLRTESYVRATVAAMKVITPRHNQLSNAFRKWLAATHRITASQEQAQIDVRFVRGDETVLAELKVCQGGTTRHAIREALGQLFEYNYYPSRAAAHLWMIVLDMEPSVTDRAYVATLREALQIPLWLAWQNPRGFAFHPAWPE